MRRVRTASRARPVAGPVWDSSSERRYGGPEPRVLLYGLPSPPMLVDLLPLVVVVRVKLAVRSGHRLSRLVRLEALVQDALPCRAGSVSESLIAQHQVVVGLQILRLDPEDGWACG